MADTDSLPNPDTLTRQPGSPSAGDINTEEQISPEDALAEAKSQIEAAERDRDTARAREASAHRERDEALSRETQAGARAVSAQEQAVATAITAQTHIIDQAKAAIANAQSAGDAVAVADAFDQLAEARAAIRDLGNQKAWLEQQKTAQPTRQSQPDGVTVRTPGGSMTVTAGAKAWMDDNPRFYNDRTFYNHAVAAHGSITGDGIQEGTPAYFRALSDEMRGFEEFEAFKRGDTKEPPMTTEARSAPPPRRMSAAAMGAPVSRSTAPTTRSGAAPDPNAVARRLGVDVGDLRDFAKINGYTAQKYGGDENAAFSAYLKAHQEIADIDRAGGDTGIRVDGAWR